MCKFMQEFGGCRSYGANMPGYAQGCYLPDDEPGTYCKISGELCYLEQGLENTPEACEFQEPTGENCEECGASIYRNGNGIVYCANCGVLQ